MAFGTANGPTRFGPLAAGDTAASTMVAPRAAGAMMMPGTDVGNFQRLKAASWIACSIAM